uniref:Uncharacterized protein n=1 Tax=Panagrellus redivivus TaxID=6233 RepID=A0A7E5A064_PANRE
MTDPSPAIVKVIKKLINDSAPMQPTSTEVRHTIQKLQPGATSKQCKIIYRKSLRMLQPPKVPVKDLLPLIKDKVARIKQHYSELAAAETEEERTCAWLRIHKLASSLRNTFEDQIGDTYIQKVAERHEAAASRDD